MLKLGENILNSHYFDMCRISSLLGNCVYEISAPPKEFPSINGNCFPVNLTKNPCSIYQAQGAFFGETTVKLYVKYKSIMNNFNTFINAKRIIKNLT